MKIDHKFYVYIWNDPANGIPRYVGKGRKSRAFNHIEHKSPYRYARMLKKRHNDGYICFPHFIWVENGKEAKELEIFLIELIGREDIGSGTLWNSTAGGEGAIGLNPQIISARNKSIGDAQRNIPKSQEHINALKQGQLKRTARSATSIGVTVEEWIAMGHNEQQRRRRKLVRLLKTQPLESINLKLL